MFHVLLESSARVPRRAGWTIASTAAHVTLITVAVMLTLGAPTSLETERLIQVISWRPPAPVRPIVPSVPHLLPFGPGNIEVPLEAPTVPIVQSNFGDVAVSLAPTGTAGADLFRDAFHPPIIEGGVHSVSSVERQVVPRSDNPPPEYPSALQSAQVEGSVLVQFVVDTTGHVEHTSIAIVKASHEQFASAVRRWLARTRYTPAQIRGRPVRQLVQQEVAFSLDR